MHSPLARAAILAALTAGLAAPASAGAATRYITPGGLNSGSCLTTGTACSYSRVLNAGGPTVNGDTVMVAPGSYNVNAAEISLTKRVDVIGSNAGPKPVFLGSDSNVKTFQLVAGSAGTTLTNIDVRASGSNSTALWSDVQMTGRQLALASGATCVYLTAPGSTLEDITASATSSGSSCINAVVAGTTLRRLDITQSGSGSSGLFFGGDGSTAEDVRVLSAGLAASFYNPANAAQRTTVRRAVLSGANYHSTLTSGPVLLTDSFLRASGPSGGALSVMTGDTQVRNLTAIATGTDSHAIRVESAPPATPTNLLARNVIARGVFAAIVLEPGKPDPSCIGIPGCAFPDHVPGTAARSHSNTGSVVGAVQDLGGNQTDNPQFRDPAAGDYRLSPGSPAIDAGTGDALNGPLDLNGLQRTLGAAPDIGAYEFDPGPAANDPPPAGVPGGTVPEGSSGNGDTVMPDTIMPLVGGARVTNRVFTVTRAQTPVTARTKRGTAFSYMLSETSKMEITIQRRAAGRRKGTRCVKPTRALARAKRCTRYVAAGKLTRVNQMGSVKVPFSGRVGKRALPAGTYRATLLATDMAGNKSVPAQLTFRIVRP